MQDWGRERLQLVPDIHASPGPGPGPTLAADTARPTMKKMMTWQGSRILLNYSARGWLLSL